MAQRNHSSQHSYNDLILEMDRVEDSFFNTIFVSSHMYNPEGTQVIVGSMNMGYISDTARNRTHNLFRPKQEPIPLVHSDWFFTYSSWPICYLWFCRSFHPSSSPLKTGLIFMAFRLTGFYLDLPLGIRQSISTIQLHHSQIFFSLFIQPSLVLSSRIQPSITYVYADNTLLYISCIPSYSTFSVEIVSNTISNLITKILPFFVLSSCREFFSVLYTVTQSSE